MIIKSFELVKIDFKDKYFFYYMDKMKVIKSKLLMKNLKNYTKKVPIYMRKVKSFKMKESFLTMFYQNHFLKKKN